MDIDNIRVKGGQGVTLALNRIDWGGAAVTLALLCGYIAIGQLRHIPREGWGYAFLFAGALVIGGLVVAALNLATNAGRGLITRAFVQLLIGTFFLIPLRLLHILLTALVGGRLPQADDELLAAILAVAASIALAAIWIAISGTRTGKQI